MRTAIEQTDVFAFDELSERAKETARDWYREGLSDREISEAIATVPPSAMTNPPIPSSSTGAATLSPASRSTSRDSARER